RPRTAARANRRFVPRALRHGGRGAHPWRRRPGRCRFAASRRFSLATPGRGLYVPGGVPSTNVIPERLPMLASSGALTEYLEKTAPERVDTAFVGYLAALGQVASVVPGVAASIVRELADQRANLKLIASENYCSLATQLAMGNLLTDKYAEGFPEHRFYAGCANVDAIETHACEEAKRLFGADHAYVQPHSGADANLIAYWAILQTRVAGPRLEQLGEKNLSNLSLAQWNELRRELGNQRLLGLDYYSGGHLTHGYRFNVSAQMFEPHSYSVSRETGLLDYD